MARLRTLVCFFVVVIGCASLESTAAPRAVPRQPRKAAKADETLQGEVLKELRQYYADFSARDWQAFSSHFWPGATLTTIWQPPGESHPRVVANSIPDFVAQAPRGPGSKPIFDERMTRAEVRAVNDLAQVWAHYTARFGEPGKVDAWSGIDAFTLLKQQGRWKIVSLAYSAEH